MFLGEYEHTIDAKGRLAVPAKFRPKMARGAVLTRGVESCLCVYPLETWEEKARQIEQAQLDSRQRRQVERRFFAVAFECELDGQGRIVLPARFREYAGLNSEVTVVGARDRFEIWDRTRWQQYIGEIQPEDLEGLDIPF
jgi:MraZ protein